MHRTLQLFLLPKLLRICRMFKKLNTWAAADLFRILKLTILFLLMGHWVGCIWFYLGRWQIAHGSLNAFTGRMTWLQAFPGGGRAYLDADVRTKYTASLYWAVTTMTTVGYGDIVPLTNVERAFTCCVQLIGAVGTALVFGNVALLMQTSDGTAARYRQRLAAVQQFCARHAVPPSLAARIRASVDYLWAAHAGLDAPAILAELSLPLQAEVLGHVQQHVVHTASLFKHCDSNLINAVVVRLRVQVILPGDDVYTTGDSGSELFFISRGSVHVTDPAGPVPRVIATLHEGEFFGEVEAFGARSRRCVTVTAATYCDLHVISKADLDDILLDFPEYRTALQAAADQRLAELTARGAAVSDLWSPDDVTTPPSSGLTPPVLLGHDAATDGDTFTGLAQAERMLDAVIAAQTAQEQALHAKLWALEEAHAAMAAKLEALTARHAEAEAAAAARVQGDSGRLRSLVRSATARMAQTTRRIRPVALETVSGAGPDERDGSP
jgi:CRP-like cAMP-binding protein